MNILKNLLASTSLIQKRAGLYVSRPIVNGKRWHDWAVKAGVPNPVPADRMHVTVVYSRVDVKCRPATDTYDVLTERAVIQRLGADGAVLVVVWDDCYLSDRHWFFRSNGATSDWAGYRVHVTLSYDAGDYEVPDEMLSQMPEMIVLGPEVHSPLNEDAVADLKKSIPGGDAHEPDTEDQAMAKSALEHALSEGVGTGLERAIVRDLAAGHPVSAKDLVALGGADWLVKFYAAAGGEAAAEGAAVTKTGEPTDEEVQKRAGELVAGAVLDPTIDQASVETLAKIAAGEDVPVLEIAALPEALMEKLSGFIRKEREVLKSDGMQVDEEEERIAWGWATVAKKNGEDVVDSHGEKITMKAVKQMVHGLITGSRAGNFEHVGPAHHEIVEAMVFCAERQKALGIDLGMEGALIAMRIPDDNHWELVKSGDWMFSIEARGIITATKD
jgi:hypothetical protein